MNTMVAPAIENFPVTFNSVSINKKSASIGIKIERDDSIGVGTIEETFCGRRLTGVLKLGKKGDQADQVLIFDNSVQISGTFDSHRISIGPEDFSFRCSFNKKDIDTALLGDFSSGIGRIEIEEVGLIPVDVVDEDDVEDGSLPGSLKADGPWRAVSMDDLFSGGILKVLKAAGIATVGDLHDYQQPTGDFVPKLIDIKGLGESKVTQVEDRMVEFWRDNPQDD